MDKTPVFTQEIRVPISPSFRTWFPGADVDDTSSKGGDVTSYNVDRVTVELADNIPSHG